MFITQLKKIRKFLLVLSSNISVRFFYTPCYLTIVFKTYLYNKIRNLPSDFNIIKGHYSLDPNILDSFLSETKNLKPSNASNKYFTHRFLTSIPLFVRNIILHHKNDIESYLGANYINEKPTFITTRKIPKDLEMKEFYSNAWHLDSTSYKLLKIFILTETVTKNDGPLTYLTKKQTRDNWHLLKKRGVNSNLYIPGQSTFTGKKGDYLIIDTSKNLHKASNPDKQRNMIIITLNPSWDMDPSIYQVYKYHDTTK